MKTRSLVAGVITVAILAGGGALAVNMLEKKTEQAVRDVLSTGSASAETVKYSLLGKKLTLGNMTYDVTLAGQHSSGSVESVIVDGFDTSCLDEKASGLPLVADSLVVSGMKNTGRSGEMVSTAAIGEMRIEGWYQNLGKLAALYQAQPWGEAFWAEAYRYRMEMLAYKNYTVTVSNPKSSKAIVQTVALMGLMGPAGGKDGADSRLFSMFANDIKVDVEGQVLFTMGRVEMRDLLMPAPAIMAQLMPLVTEMSDPANKGKENATAEKMLSLLSDAYAKESPYSAILCQKLGIIDSKKSKTAVKVDELENTLTVGTPFLFGMRAKGWNMDATVIPSKYRSIMEAFMPTLIAEGLTVDGSVNFSLAPASVGPSRIEWAAALPGMGDTKGSVDLTLNVANLGQVLDNPEVLSRAALLTAVNMTYSDSGLLPMVIALMAQTEEVKPLAAQQALLADLPNASKSFGEAGPMVSKALGVMLEKPGTLTVSAKMKSPTPVAMAMMALLLSPGDVNLQFSAEPGPKDFADWLPAAMK